MEPNMHDTTEDMFRRLEAQLAEAQARAEKAETMLSLIEGAVEHDDCSDMPLDQRVAGAVEGLTLMIGQVIKEKKMADALAAHVASLLRALEDLRLRTGHPIAIAAINATPQSSLARVRAEALRTVAKKALAHELQLDAEGWAAPCDIAANISGMIEDEAERLESEAANG